MQQSKWSTWESQLCCCTCGGFCQGQQVVSIHCTLCACATQVMYWHSISDNAAAVCAGSVNLTQTHPAAPYVCRTGNITLRCQYGGVGGVLNVVWNVDDMVNLDFDSMNLLLEHLPYNICPCSCVYAIVCCRVIVLYCCYFPQWPAHVHKPQWQWQCCQSSCHLCWRCHCPPAQSVQWCMQWCTRDCRGAELSWEGVSCAAHLSCPSPSCEAGLLPPSMQGEGTVSKKQVQKGRGPQQGRRERKRRCRLTQPTCPLRWATSLN